MGWIVKLIQALLAAINRYYARREAAHVQREQARTRRLTELERQDQALKREVKLTDEERMTWLREHGLL